MSVNPGLDGVLVTETDISFIDGEEGTLIYRGYAIQDLAREASFEEIIHLLWHGTLPTEEEYAEIRDTMARERALDDDVLGLVRTLAEANEQPMAALRTAVSTLSAFDPDSDADPSDPEANLRKGRRITAKIPTILAALKRIRDGDDPVAPREDLDHAANFLYMLNGEEPNDVLAETFDMALVLHADHGINASTFSARVTASTLADIHSAVTSAVGALSGSWHGGANQDVMRMLQKIDKSDLEPDDWVVKALEEGRRIPGFGHRVYKVKDPRAYILAEKSESLGRAAGDLRWHEYGQAVESYVTDAKGLAPNLDFYSSPTYYQLGIPLDLYTPIFAMSRVSGWIAHLFDQYEENRLIRPRGRYTGPTEAEIVPLNQR